MEWDIDVKEKVYQRLANEIFFRIYHGIYRWVKHPSYIDIAKEAGSSPETVRKAIRELQTRGVVNKTRQGYFMTSEQEKVQEYCDNYMASLEREYLIAKGKVDK